MEINERGFELIQNDTDWTKEGSNKNDKSDSNEDLAKLTTESWEVSLIGFQKLNFKTFYVTKLL